MLISTNITKRVNIPHEPGQYMVLRKLTRKQLRRASDVKTGDGIDMIRRMGGDIFGQMQAASAKAVEEASKRAADPATQYDEDTVLEFGIASWSYDTPKGKESLEAVDPITATWAFKAIIDFTNEAMSPDQVKNSPAVLTGI